MKTTLNILSLLVFIFLITNTLRASVIIKGEEVNVTEPVAGNLYTAGGKVTINAQIGGDLTAAGGNVTVLDSIQKDMLLAGGELRLRGAVGEDLRVAGGDITIENDIGGDLLVAGGEIEVRDNVIIYGDVIIAGGSLEINGTANGVINLAAGELEFNGVAENGLIVKGGELELNGEVRGKSELSASEISLGPNAKFYGDIRYWQRDGKMNFEGALMDGATATFDPSLKFSDAEFNWKKFAGAMMLLWILRFLSGCLMIALLIWFFHRFFENTVDNLYQKYGNKLGWGLLYFVVIPFAILILMATVIGIPIGLVLTAIYGFSVVFAKVLTAVVATYEVQRYLKKEWSRGRQILVGIGLYALIKIVTAIPFLGWLISLILVSMALGAILLWIFKKQKGEEVLV